MTPVPEIAEAPTYESLASRLDVPLLDPFWSADQVYEACVQARKFQVRSVITRPCDCELAVQWLANSGVLVAAATGYPGGSSTTGTKLFETRDLLRLGTKEIEFSVPVARLLSRQFQHVETELLQAVKACHESGATLTAVYHSAHLTDDLKIILTKICRRVEADVVAVDGGAAEIALITPMLKDVLRLKLASPVSNLTEALAAVHMGYTSCSVSDPATVLLAWRDKLAEDQQANKLNS
ncbi:MAG: hypothetical protein H7039_17680 [Bryobacteraceae bacterium]|nr:hypothetical protein [Bryobacteraceae bacterium]